MQHSDNQLRPGAPAERYDAPDIYLIMQRSGPPTETITETIEPIPEPLPEYVAEIAVELASGYIAQTAATETAPVVIEPLRDMWREPAYSEAVQESMYSPGIVRGEYRKEQTKPEPKPKRFWRAVGLIAACAAISIAAAYGAIEFRIRSGDFPTVNQVVLGAEPGPRTEPAGMTPGTTPDSGMFLPLPPYTMSAADIYDVAIQQVVAIRAGSGGRFDLTQPGRASGSGFIVSADGYILTNYHVIEPAYLADQPITVYLFNGSAYEARVIGHDAQSDVAVIKIEAGGLMPVVIGDSDELRVGQRVYAVGNPFGDLTYTMTDGIVSALERVVTVEDRTINTFQLSAAVNPGNSGGPVYNISGEVIGIVTAKLAADRLASVEGIGFAIPINDAIAIASELIEHGFIPRARMGVYVSTVTSAVAAYRGWERGAYIESVTPGSAAEAAGIQAGDIVTHLENYRVMTHQELIMRTRRHRAGDTADITIWRDGEVLELEITFNAAD
ncbi:MAG: trypsin-like peptidase domain-containing protein [Oscillospiraceae bacterium]|nr:trypsin-like peptidase domain-containing protein [Oscillospiraceae bacterium]